MGELGWRGGRTWIGLIAWVGLVAAAPASGQEVAVREVEGSLTYRERIALPPEAHAIVEVRGTDDDVVLAETRLRTEGRQVPIPFALKMPPDVAGTLRGGVFRG
ncbi:MAG: hypothetical protein GVY27_12935, partial [Deinococcus-Thermus bacterium]|nr:hypothetical protein [Deinococcota bacterium]